MSHYSHRRKWLNNTASSDESSASEDSVPKTAAMNGNASNRSESPTFKPGATPTNNTSSPGARLAQEIHDEFLICKICLDSYKNPKCLTCLHTFCEQCIENHVNSESSYKKYSDYREFTCPLCRKRTQLPVGGVKKLQDNFLVSSLTEVVGRQRSSKYPFCDICKMINHKHREASSKCLDCAKLLCAGCVKMHRETKVTSSHSVYDVEIEKEIECKEHQNEVVRFYCEPCDACICIMCTFNEHRDHNITQFSEAVVKYKDSIQQQMLLCNEKIQKFDQQLESINKCEDLLKTVEQNVRDKAIEFIQEIRNRERQIIEELQNMYGPECTELISSKKDLTVQIESLRSTCSLTNVILLGKDIELLLLKKDVQDKLELLGKIEVKNLPATMNKVVEFVAGTVDLGYIHDYDRPLLSKMRTRRANTQDLYDTFGAKNLPVSDVETVGTQTDPEWTDVRRRPSANAPTKPEPAADSDAEPSDGDGDDESSDSSDDEAETKGDKHTDMAVQTETADDDSTSSDENENEKIDEETMTDAVQVEERGINTTSQALSPVNSFAGANDSADDNADNSLAVRRRRRRERIANAATESVNSSSSPGPASYDQQNEDSMPSMACMSLVERRRLRSSYVLNHRSLDTDDVYYDAK